MTRSGRATTLDAPIEPSSSTRDAIADAGTRSGTTSARLDGRDWLALGFFAVVAIVLILGILFLLGLIVVAGGAFLFVARSSSPMQMPTVTTTVAPVPTDVSEPVAVDLESSTGPIEKTDTETK